MYFLIKINQHQNSISKDSRENFASFFIRLFHLNFYDYGYDATNGQTPEELSQRDKICTAKSLMEKKCIDTTEYYQTATKIWPLILASSTTQKPANRMRLTGFLLAQFTSATLWFMMPAQ